VIGAIAAEAAGRFGPTPAYVGTTGLELSYADLDQLADEVAVAMDERGVGDGSVVCLLLPASPEYVVAYVAASRLGAITVGVNSRLAEPERQLLLESARPWLVLATPGLAPPSSYVEAEVHRVELAASPEDLLADLRGAWTSGESPPPLAEDLDRPVAIVFTSGTTGLPKGVVFAGRQLEAITAIDTGGRWGGGGGGGGGGAQLAGTSFATLGPMTKLPGNLMKGGTTHLVDRWRAEDALEMTERLGLTAIAGIPTQVALMLRHPTFPERDLSSVRAVVMGGGPATPALVREARDLLGVPVAIRYSCTEAGVGVGTTFDAPLEDAEVSVGRPHEGISLTIRGEDGTVLPDGEEGEVCLASDAVMSGYWNDPAATAAALTEDGAVRTGDVGWIDPEGRLRLTGRSKEIYVRGGYNVAPQQVEAVLAGAPGVRDIAVVPRPDDVMGEVGVAVVVPTVPSRPPTLEQLRAHGEAHLARHELPEDLLVVDVLPLTAAEKLDRRALSTMLVGG
jgi:acyl-CoA synthetase (AMP-forming)/AMP-acid ligase II